MTDEEGHDFAHTLFNSHYQRRPAFACLDIHIDALKLDKHLADISTAFCYNIYNDNDKKIKI